MAAPSIPLDVADATPEWMSRALGRAVVAVEVVDGRFDPTAAAPAEDVPEPESKMEDTMTAPGSIGR
ncbi:MAG: hypothetical protein ACRDPX_05800 [Gaiellaceae bacterium]